MSALIQKTVQRPWRVKQVIGQRYGKLIAESVAGYRGKTISYFCRCDCGGTRIVRGDLLRKGITQSCGCLRETNRHHTHGRSETPLYKIWHTMIERCERPKAKGYSSYGGRGIQVCARWKSFENFLTDMGERPSPLHSLDRIDNDGNYQPGNVRWATRSQQARNKRSNRIVTVRGVSATVAEWSERTGIGSTTIRARLDRGMNPDDAIQQVAPSVDDAVRVDGGDITGRFGRVP